MTASAGVVLHSAAQDRAVFLTGADLTALRDTLDAIVERPTVAGGPLDVAALERLARAIELAEEDDAPTVLRDVEEAGLELIKEQAAIRSSLPLRIRHTCKECGHERIVNPARKPSTAPPPGNGSGPGVDTVATSVDLLDEGHPFLAALNLFSDSTDDKPAAAPGQPACGRCDGEDFRSDVVTICPGCRAFRDESVLLTCPECEFDFRTREGGNDEFWVPPDKAAADAALARNVALLKEQASSFENNLWPGQLEALLAALRPDERLVGLCRCGLPNQVGRYVALLLTSQQLVWARQSAMSSTTGGSVPWSDVLAVHAHHGTGSTYDRGIQLEVRTGPPLLFKDFRGTGVSFTADPATFTAEAIHATVTTLWQPHRPADAGPAMAAPAMAAPAPPAPQPVGAPSPGWFPDPWRMARLRWWDGTRWTAHLTP